MGVYLKAESVINDMIYSIVTNEELMKLIVYDTTITNPLSSTPVADPQQYIYNPSEPNLNTYRLYPMMKIPNANEREMTIVCAELIRTESINNNPYYKNYIVSFNIITHAAVKTVAGGIRRDLQILDRINELYNQKYSSDTMKPLFPLSDRYVQYNTNFCGYELIYSLTNVSSSNALCNKSALSDST